jgi:hypothetical protein
MVTGFLGRDDIAGPLATFLDTKLVLTNLSLGTIFVGLATRALLVVNS